MKSPTGDSTTVSDDIRAILTPKKRKAKDSNNHHVVPLGILVVLCTVYIMAAGLQRNYRYYFRSGVAAYDLPQAENQSEESPLEPMEAQAEHHEEACQRMDIFGGDVDGNKSESQVSKRPQSRLSKRIKIGAGSKHAKAKALEISRKKEAPKKSNTAEPIIYLFALVFIYLLLKAASDINQHYKSSKGDKRLRRCSLQSYAQIHKQDRRASKAEESAIFRRRHNLGEVRSVSVDRYRSDPVGHGTGPPPVTSPLVGRHHPGDVRFEPRMNRRSSVPITINYQTVYVSGPHPAELSRRGSVISLTGQTPDASTMPAPADPKRRVRMINRH
ncbi:uncharacterized protein [Drosophila bipectinata]|uniref:uncharacterized protein isoform X2 n=1 Tax=Drosophila bipectinata TaxID=42026 RepID=UPI0038B383D2